MTRLAIFWSSFFDGFSGGGLFVRLRRPGAPTQAFADPKAPENLRPRQQDALGAVSISGRNPWFTASPEAVLERGQ